MPQVLIFAAAGAGLYAAYRIAKRLSASSRDHALRNSADAEPRDLGVLRRDPDTGDYKPE